MNCFSFPRLYFRISQYSTSSDIQQKATCVSPFGRFEFKKVLFGLAQCPTHFQQLTKEVLKGPPFAFGYLGNMLALVETLKNILSIWGLYLRDWKQLIWSRKELNIPFLKLILHFLGDLKLGRGIYPFLRNYKALQIFQYQYHLRKLDKC